MISAGNKLVGGFAVEASMDCEYRFEIRSKGNLQLASLTTRLYAAIRQTIKHLTCIRYNEDAFVLAVFEISDN